MRHKRAWRLGGLVCLAAIYAACGGQQTHNLGENANAGAGGAGAGAGTTTANGGAGGNGTPGFKPPGIGGNGEGGVGAVPATLGGTTPVKYSYPIQPTQPIDPNCTCASSAQICNAAKECVDRCDGQGRCAMWLVNRAVTAMIEEASTVYYAIMPTTDPLGNRSNDAALYRVTYPAGTPEVIASGLDFVDQILGRYQGITYLHVGWLKSGKILAVTDNGETTVVDACADDSTGSSRASLRGQWLTYVSADRVKVMRVDLAGNRTPEVLVDVSNVSPPPTDPTAVTRLRETYVLDDVIWYKGDYLGTCWIDISDPAKIPNCETRCEYQIFATSGNQIFCTDALVVGAKDARGTSLLTVYNRTDSGPYGFVDAGHFFDGWLYTSTSKNSGSNTSAHLVIRFPTNVGRLPQEVLPTEIADPQGDGSYAFEIGSDGIFFYRGYQYLHAAEPQYIFHAPFPAQPCDTQLPCANSAQVCTGGFCAAP